MSRETIMRGITILDRDERGAVAVELRELLQLVGPAASESDWELKDVECVGGSAAVDCHRLSNSGQRISGDQLIRLAAEVDQFIDGQFEAYRKNATKPWLIIRAVDSSAYDVESEDPRLLQRIQEAFRNVAEIPT
jgi:hypothetical protein